MQELSVKIRKINGTKCKKEYECDYKCKNRM